MTSNSSPENDKHNKAQLSSPKSLLALLPFVLFLCLFLGTGILFTVQGKEFAFYQLPANIAIIPAIFLAIAIGKYVSKTSLTEQVNQFVQGAGHTNIITMGIIYLLAGAFATVAKATGSVDASVLLGLSLFPDYFLLPGIFIVSALLSLAMGTSMGTIAAIAPIALGFIEATGINTGLMAGCIISGAIFGDNLSIISDTTIASTRSQGAQMQDKFKVNFTFAIPAALICLIIFGVLGSEIPQPELKQTNIFGLLPYIFILTLALLGTNVFLVLVIGIFSAAMVGFISGDYDVMQLVSDINSGFLNVQEIFILALFIGGLSELIRKQGGLAMLTEQVERYALALSPHNNKRAASIGIASMAFFCNFFTANNTVSIIVTGDTAKSIADKNGISPAHSASLLDVFSCISQGLLPYGAQALLLGATLAISPVDVVSYAFYPIILFFSAAYAFWRYTSK